jgi:hypothetical protein
MLMARAVVVATLKKAWSLYVAPFFETTAVRDVGTALGATLAVCVIVE